ncbi:MAG: hypothetical protein KAH18_07060 [Psychromonas sp.]|nr:hypothetical protein [Psychromonas sp.]
MENVKKEVREIESADLDLIFDDTVQPTPFSNENELITGMLIIALVVPLKVLTCLIAFIAITHEDTRFRTPE